MNRSETKPIPFTPENAREQAKKMLADPRIAEHESLLLDFTEEVARRVIEMCPIQWMMQAPVVYIKDHDIEVIARSQKIAVAPTSPLDKDGNFNTEVFETYAQEVAETLVEVFGSYMARGAEVWPYFLVRPMGAFVDPSTDEYRFGLATRFGAKVLRESNRNPRGH